MAAKCTSFVQQTLELLNLEKQAEINESRAFYENTDSGTLENNGVCLRKLVIFGQRTGLYGRTLLTLGKAKGHSPINLPLPAHCITAGMSDLTYSTMYKREVKVLYRISTGHFTLSSFFPQGTL
jgi:hypothetical protein